MDRRIHTDPDDLTGPTTTPSGLAAGHPMRIVAHSILALPFLQIEWFAPCGLASTWTLLVRMGLN
jgi:hypothetical protein